MQCKSCGNPLTGKKYSVFVEENSEYIDGDREEELCSKCHGVSKMAFRNLFTETPLERELLCQKMFYKEFMLVNDIVYELQTDPDYSKLTVEEH